MATPSARAELSPSARAAVAGLTAGVLAVRPLVDVLDPPVAVPGAPVAGAVATTGRPAAVLGRIAARLGAPRIAVDPALTRDRAPLFARVVGDRLGLADRSVALQGVSVTGPDLADEVVDEVAARDFAAFCRVRLVRGHDGVPLRLLTAGRPDRTPLVVALPCGTPARLGERWIRRLARDHHVLTWETRGLFGSRAELARFAGATTLDAQVGDLLAVLREAVPGPAHLVGLCGGAVLALAAARAAPRRVASISLWHGDYELGGAAPKTDHQRNLQATMRLAAGSGDRAAGVHDLLARSVGAGVPADVAHLVLYPFATPELMVRYCRLNGAVMAAEVARWLGDDGTPFPPALVVTSADDRTAHPEGSRHVAARLPGARLLVTGSGDHLSLFRAGAEQVDVAARFVAERAAAGSAAQL